MRALDLTGKSFGRLAVLGPAGKDSRGALIWNVRCLCGTEKVMRSDVIKSKPMIGCGCGREVTLSQEDLICTAGDYHTHSNRAAHVTWRNNVLANEPTCQHCGCKSDLIAHHIVPVRDDPTLLFDVSNGGTLCNSCHRKFHATYGTTGIGKPEWEKFTWK